MIWIFILLFLLLIIDSNITFERVIPDENLLNNIQMFLRNLSRVDRSKDKYANEKNYRHDEQYLKYMVSIFFSFLANASFLISNTKEV